MLRAVALVPSPPLLVPELTGAGAVEAEAVRSAALEAARMLGAVADRWLVVAAADRQAIIEPTTGGSFAGFGVDVMVALSPISSRIDSELPLAALVAGWKPFVLYIRSGRLPLHLRTAIGSRNQDPFGEWPDRGATFPQRAALDDERGSGPPRNLGGP